MTKLIPTKYTIYRADGSVEEVTRDLPRDPGYSVLREITDPILDGAWLERVMVLHDGEVKDMLVDEEGLLKDLPVNVLATEIYHNNLMKNHRTAYDRALATGMLNSIVGNAILFHRKVWF